MISGPIASRYSFWEIRNLSFLLFFWSFPSLVTVSYSERKKESRPMESLFLGLFYDPWVAFKTFYIPSFLSWWWCVIVFAFYEFHSDMKVPGAQLMPNSFVDCLAFYGISLLNDWKQRRNFKNPSPELCKATIPIRLLLLLDTLKFGPIQWMPEGRGWDGPASRE